MGGDLVLLPGMDGTGDLLAPLAAHLSKQRTVTTVRYPLDGPQTYAHLTAFARAALPDRPCVVLGESFSGPIAMALAAADPRVTGLILASTFARNPMPALLTPFMRLDPKLVPFPIIAQLLLGAGHRNLDATALRPTLARVPTSVLRARLAAVRALDVRATLPKLECPVLCLQGRRDWLVRASLTHEMSTLSGNAEVVWLDAPHMLLTTHVADATAAIERFCDRVSGRAVGSTP